jgi:hypothetical protein
MTTETTFVGAKGGVGTSTVAALYALQFARSGQAVRLTATDAVGVEDLAAILGIPAPGPGQAVEVAPGLSLADHRDPEGTNVVDAGTDTFSDRTGRILLIIRNDYLSLRRALAAQLAATGLILVSEPHRALGRRDAEDVLAIPVVAELTVDPSIARATDAGLLARVRPPLGLAQLDCTSAAR